MSATLTVVQPGTAARSPVVELGESFLIHLAAANKSPHTRDSYREAIRQFDAFLAATQRPRDPARVQRADVEQFSVHLQQAGLKPSTVQVRLRSLQSFFRWLLEEKEIPANPIAVLATVKQPEAPPPVVREADLERLFKKLHRRPDSFETRRDVALLTLLAHTGIRRAELMGLRYTPGNDATHDVLDGLTTLRVRRKGNRIETVPLDAQATKALDRYLRARARHKRADLPWLWLGPRGRLTDNGLFQVVRRAGRAVGLELHPHSFRHTFADAYLRAGGQEGDLMRVAGWRSRNMVMRYAQATQHERAMQARRALVLYKNI